MDKFDPKDPAELVPLTFRFQALIPKGDSISGAPTVACTVFSGTDVNPGDVLSGAASVVGSSVHQNVRNGVLGVEYLIRVTVTTVAGFKFTIGKVLPITYAGTY